MTIEETLTKYLTDRGLFEDEASFLLMTLKIRPSQKSMEGRWSDEVEGYPPYFLTALTMALDSVTLEWIDAKKPQAWHRGLFAPKDAGE